MGFKKSIFYSFTLLLLIFLINSCRSLHDFNDECGTPEISDEEFEKLPWYGNNQMLDKMLDSLNYYKSEYNFSNVLYRVPVKFWIFRDKQGKTTASEKDLKNLVNELNQSNFFNKTGFTYYIRPDYEYINSKDKNIGYYVQGPSKTIFHHSKGCINVFVVGNLVQKKKGPDNYLKGTYNKVTKSIIVERPSGDQTLPHEIGHYFGLLHPHKDYKKGKCKQEAVSRTRIFEGCLKKGLICETSGDGLCDTPAEPNLIRSVDKNCDFTGKELKDLWGDSYKPNTDNIMSYPSYTKCRKKFTPNQIAVMVYIAKEIADEAWDGQIPENAKYKFDAFEPDNTKDMANEIQPNIPQYHTFHQVYMGKGEINLDTDIDWVKFEISGKLNKHLTIQTYSADNQSPDTEIFLFDSNNNLVTSDNDSNLKGFSRIFLEDLREGVYFIKIVKRNSFINNSLFDYYLRIEF